MIICPHCGTLVFPFINSLISVNGRIGGGFDSPGGTVSGGGSTIEIAPYCCHCGYKLFDFCAICRHTHIAGFRYCPVTGKSLDEYEKEMVERTHVQQQERMQEQTQRQAREEKDIKLKERIREIESRLNAQLRGRMRARAIGYLLVQAVVMVVSWNLFHPTGLLIVLWLVVSLVAVALPFSWYMVIWMAKNIYDPAREEASNVLNEEDPKT